MRSRAAPLPAQHRGRVWEPSQGSHHNRVRSRAAPLPAQHRGRVCDPGVWEPAQGSHHNRAVFRERLALNLSSIRWDGLVHERLVGTTIGRAAHLEGSLVVRDLRDSRGAGTRAPGRNLKILYHSARSRRWEISPREMAYLAAEARSAMPSLAARVAECCYDNSTWDEERAWAAATRAGVAEDAGELHLARGWHRRSLLAYATPAAALRLARASFAVGSWRDVVDHWRMAANLEGALQLIDAGEVDEVEVAGMAARSLLAYGRHDEVEDMCRKILSRYPGAAVPAEILRGIEASGKKRG